MDDTSGPDHGSAPDGDDPGAPASVVRSIDLDCDLDAAWRLVATADGLDRWLGTDVRMDPVVGGALGLRDGDGVLRTGRVVEVDEGRALVFEWAEVGDAASRSTVTVTIDGDGEGASRVTVEERRAGGRVTCCADAGAVWEGRLLSLGLEVWEGGPGASLLTAVA